MEKKEILCVIPARYASTRLPAKPLSLIKDLPLIMWAYNAAMAANVFSRVCVATDDIRIHETVLRFGGMSEMTSPNHCSGTDRVHEVATRFSAPLIANLQGDEPLMPPDLLKEFVGKLRELDDNSLLTCVSNATIKDKENPNVVKAVCAKNGQALYFSRAPIPYDRDAIHNDLLTHWGIYGFTKTSLDRFCSFEPGVLEQREKLEQLRALENGMHIHCIITKYKGCGIDTPQDLAAFRKRAEGPA